MCFLAITAMSLSAKAQEVTITLYPGNTWISYPNAVVMDVASALGDFVPAEGDIIRSQYASSTYRNGRWRGGVTHFMPGWGYMYYSNRTEVVSFVFASSTPQSQVQVTTSEPMLITAISAMCGGEVSTTDGTYILVKGLCWATHENPTTNEDFFQEAESGVGTFSVSMTGLNISTMYYVRAYAVTPNGTVYGDQKTFTTRDGIPTVTTAEVTNILGVVAIGGGNITDDGGLVVTARGVCWSTSPSPTLADAHTSNGSGAGSFSSYMTGLSMSTTYYVRAYATNSFVTVYGNQLSFTTLDDYVYVDLGLPSGLLWATCNVGADTPEDYGDYFAWGETQPKDTYNWSTYQYCMGNSNTLTKYCTDASYGYNGFTDDLTTLLPEDDAATANWGSDWRMPTEEEWQELYNNTTCTWTTQNGVNGRLFTATNGNSLFLPAAGDRSSSLYGAGSYGYYWSSSLKTGDPGRAWFFDFGSDYYGMSSFSRYFGISVRPVRSAQNTVPTGAIDGKFTINEDGDQVYFSQGNLQYIGSAATPYWKFADNQWDILGTTTGQNSSDQNVDRDLFGWGTSGYNHGANSYQPWSTSTSHSDYYAYGSSTYNLYDQTGQADWGYNPISNGGNQTNQWRTLTHAEWDYVFNSRSTNSGIRYAKAKVNDVKGVILLPDDWSSDTYSLSNTNSSGASYGSNTITASQWSIMEQVGAVFLPDAGYRLGTMVYNSSSGYWSAALYGSTNACIVFFGSSLGTPVITSRYEGRSVRLVRVVES